MIVSAQVDALAVADVHQAAIEFEILGGDLDLAGRLAHRLAGVLALQRRQLADRAADSAGDLGEDAAALDRPAITPFV